MDFFVNRQILRLLLYVFASVIIVNSVSAQNSDTASFSDSINVSVADSGLSGKDAALNESSGIITQNDTLVSAGTIQETASFLENMFDMITGSISPGSAFHNKSNLDIQNDIGLLPINQDTSAVSSFSLYPFQFHCMISADPNRNYFLIKGSMIDYSQTHTLISGYKVDVRVDSMGAFYVFEDYYGENTAKRKNPLRQKTVISRKEYLHYNFENQIRNTFTKTIVTALATKEAEGQTGPLRLFSTSVTTNETFQKIFGGDEVAVDARGSINLNMSVTKEASSNQNASTGKNSQIIPKFEQKQQFNLRATIGKKVEILIDQDSEREFEFENNIRIIYTGFDDEVLQRLEAGNIDLSLPGTEFVTAGGQNKGLFGVKALMRFGDLNVTTIASLQRGEKTKLSFKGGAGQGNETKIKEFQYARAKYFFLDTIYRIQFENYNNRIHTYNSSDEIINWKIYKYSASTQSDPRVRPAKASFDDNSNPERGDFLELENGVDYNIDQKLGIISLSTRLADAGEMLAVWYQTKDRIHGNVSPGLDTLQLKLIWGPNPNPNDPMWNYELKNIYDLGIRGLTDDDRKTIKIQYNVNGSSPLTSIPDKNEAGVGILSLLHVDETSDQGGAIDDIVDLGGGFNYGLDLEQGLIVFPRLRPFDPADNVLNGFSEERYPNGFNNGTVSESVRFPNIYDQERTNLNEQNFASNSRFEIVYRSSKRSAHIQLGFNVLEGSEEVKVNGRTLTKDVDYIIDYFSGTIDLLSQEALMPTSDLEIDYEQAQLFQVDKKAIFGARAEYNLAEWGFGQNSFIGTTALFQSQSTINKRVQIGEEPFRNFVWDVNTSLDFDVKIFTKAINYLPLVNSSASSKINFRAEYATILPNPNTSNGLMKQDERGVAYVDDFEAIKRTFPLGTSRKMWVLGSKPIEKSLDERGRTIWFQRQEPRKYITNIATQAGDQITVLGMAFQPKLVSGDYRNSWGGIMRGLNISASKELSESRFIELWINTKTNNHCFVNIEIGMISEDQNGNGTFDKEIKGTSLTNILESDTQDVGLDGLSDVQENDLLSSLGIEPGRKSLNYSEQRIVDSLQAKYPWGKINYSRSGPSEDPFGDNWNENHAQPRDYSGNPISANDHIESAIRDNDLGTVKVNGTENNGGYKGQSIDGSLRYQDTEDIDGDRVPSFVNSYFRYTFSTDTTSADTSLIIGKGDFGWRLYRIPVSLPDTALNQATLQKINGVRFWINPLENSDKIIALLIADFQFVTSDWTISQDYPNGLILPPNAKVPDPIEASQIVEISSVNTEESNRYTRPPGVKQEYTSGQTGGADKRAVKEQSLSLKLNNLPAQVSAIIVKNIVSSDFRNYESLKMFIHGDKTIYNGIVLPNENDTASSSPVNVFFRFGNNKNHYYEIEQPLFSGWAIGKNSIEIDFTQLTSLKFDATIQADSNNVRTYFVDNKIIRIKGNPSLAAISQLYVGAANNDLFRPYTGEIWMDELRLSGANDKPGHAAKASMSFNMGDLLTFNSMIQYRTSEFRTVEQRFDANSGNTQSWNIGGSFNLHKFYIEKWGISLPVTANLSHSRSNPKYVPNNDILVSTAKSRNKQNLSALHSDYNRTQDSVSYYQSLNDTASVRRLSTIIAKLDSQIIYEESFEARMQTVTTSFGYGVSFSKSKSEDNFWLLRYTIDNVTSSFNYSFSESKTPQYVSNRNFNWSSTTAYNLPVKKASSKPLDWMPFSTFPIIGQLFKNLKETDLNYFLITNTTTDFQVTSTNSRVVERSVFGFPVKKPDVNTLTSARGYGLSLSPIQSLTSSLSVRYQSDLRGLSASEILTGVAKGLNPFDGFDDFVTKSAIDTVKRGEDPERDSLIFNRDFSVSNTFTLSYNPQLFSFISNNFSYNSTHSSNRARSPATFFNQNSQLSRRAQLDANLQLKSFINALKEPFSKQGSSAGTGKSQSGGSRRERAKSSVEKSEKEKADTSDVNKTQGGGGRSFSKISEKIGSWGERILQMINDPRFSISFDNSISMTGLDKKPNTAYSWLGYTTSKNSGFFDNLFNFDLDPVNEFIVPDTSKSRGLFQYNPRKAIAYNMNYGFNFNFFTVDIRYEYSEARMISNNIETRTITESVLFPMLKDVPFPFFDMTFRAQNLGRHNIFKFMNTITSNFGIGLTYSKKAIKNINEYNPNVASIDSFYSQGKPFQISSITDQEIFPQISIDITWKGNISQSITFSNSTSRSFQPTSTQNSNTKTLTSNISYSKRGGFKLPLPFLGNKKINNEVRIGTTFNLSKRKSFSTSFTGSGESKSKTKNIISDDTSWSVEPRVDYSFTSRLTGGLFFKYEHIETHQAGKISRFAGGFTANITIGS